MWRIASATDSYRPDTEDRAVVARGERIILAVADGVGGRPFGGPAAGRVAEAARALAVGPSTFHSDRVRWMTELDQAMASADRAGETTGVVVELTARGAVGVLVGDSVAWDIRDDGIHNQIRDAERKPWLGSGSAVPVTFGLPRNHLGTLLLATDGLVKYAPAAAIREVIRTVPFDEIPKRLIDRARMPSGGLQDDVAVIVARWEVPPAAQLEED